MNQQPQIETIVLKRDADFPLRFRGRKLAEVSSLLDENGNERRTGNRRWTEISLYQTEGGKYVCEHRGCSRVPGESVRRDAQVCETTEEVYAYFGKEWLSQRLYQAVGLERYEDVD